MKLELGVESLRDLGDRVIKFQMKVIKWFWKEGQGVLYFEE